MKRYDAVVCLFFAVTLVPSVSAFCQEKPAETPAHRVAAVYFHRTNRCPTCKLISAYIEESVKTGFAQELTDGEVSLHLVDYQNPENAKYTKSYKITKPTMVLVDVRNGKVTAWKPMPKVWTLVRKKDEFFKYVQQGVRDYLGSE
jgi:hypothetical protein